VLIEQCYNIVVRLGRRQAQRRPSLLVLPVWISPRSQQRLRDTPVAGASRQAQRCFAVIVAGVDVRVVV
jgi:hypothetical protein